MKRKHKKTLESVFKDPVLSNVIWDDIENLFIALGAEITEGSGSRVRIALNNVKAVFHRPHPEKETDKGALKSIRQYLKNAGVKL
ncbi:MAG: hypothetical protein ACI9S8_002673 [Chlamydiales bacterium]